MIDRKKIAEKLRKIAEDCAISGSIAVNKTNAALYAAADERDPPEPKPLLADAKVGDLCKTDLDEWIQIDDASEPPSPILYHFDRPFKGNIIHTEPLASEGSAEWAWQMLILQKPVSHPAEGIWRDTYYSKDGFVRCMAKTGWQLYEPDHDFNVGDWVEFRDIEGIKHGIIKGRREEYSVLCNGISQSVGDKFITRKLDPSEVVIHIGCLSGTVEKAQDYAYFLLWHSKTDCDYSMIKWSAIDAPTRELVKALLKAQEGER